MAINLYKKEFSRIPDEELNSWAKIPTAIIGDSLNRQNVMRSDIKAIVPCRFSGQARTVSTIAGDNGAIHAAMQIIKPREVLIVDGGGYNERALWGGILNRIAIEKKVAAIVIDGGVRDINELRVMSMPIFAASNTPAGPHKGWGGEIDSNISCGGVSVSPGDLVIGDDDGVVVVPLEKTNSVLKLSQKQLDQEEEILSKISQGLSLEGAIAYPEVNIISSQYKEK